MTNKIRPMAAFPNLLMLAVALVLSGCGGNERASAGPDDEPATSLSMSDDHLSMSDDRADPSPNGDPTVGQADDGISVTEAEQTDVLTGDYDMLLRGPQGAAEIDGCLVFQLTASNVGKQPDTYRFETETGSLDTDATEPDRLSLDPGDNGQVAVEVCDQNVESLKIQAFSDGLGGQLIGEVELG